MKNNKMTISFSKNPSSPDLEFVSSLDLCTNSPSRPCYHIPPSTVKQAVEQAPLAAPPSKKPRGRPPGSKNKPKPYELQVPQYTDPTTKHIIVNVPPGGNVIDYIVDVARRGHVSVTILSATGNVARVSLRHAPHSAPPVMIHGPLTLISLHGSYIYNNEYILQPGATPPFDISFGINLCTSTGQVFGGTVNDRIEAASNGIQLVLSTFKNPSIYKYVPGVEETDNDNNKGASNFNGIGNLSGYNFADCKIPRW